MALKFLKRRWQKILFTTILASIAVIIIGSILINILAPSILSKRLKAALSKGTDSLYRADFKLKLNILKGKAVLYDLNLIPDTIVFKSLKQKGKAPNNLYNLQVSRFEVSGMHFIKMFLNKKLDIGLIKIDSPRLQARQYINEDKKLAKDNTTLYQKIQESLKMIHVGEIEISGANYKMANYTQAKPTHSELRKLDLKATELLIDSTTQSDTSRTFFCKDIITEVHNYYGKSANSLYTYKAKSLKFSTQRARLDITGINLLPAATGQFFTKNNGDRFTLHLDSVQLHNFDYSTYHKTQAIKSAKIAIIKGYFEVFSNYNSPPAKTDRVVTFPNWAIRNAIKADVMVDTLDIKKLNIVYKEYNKLSKKTGAIQFDNTSARFLNITNKKESLKKNNIATAALTTYFMGKGKLDLNFRFNLTDPAFGYSYKGHLGPLDMTVANPAVMPLSLVKVASGNIKTLDFNIRANRNTSTGTVNFLYNDLKVEVLRQDDEKGYSKKTLLTLFANGFVVSSNNPDKPGEKPRTATVIFKRPANFPFFKTVWLALLSGIKSCAGVGDAKEDVKLKKNLTEKELKAKQKELKKAQEKKEDEEKAHQKRLKEKSKKQDD